MPRILPGVGLRSLAISEAVQENTGTYTKVLLTVARVAIRLAQPKVMPVVTANWPTKLTQPVVQLKNAASSLLGDSMAAQKYL